MQIQTILHPTDFSAASYQALNFASVIAETFYARLIIVHVDPAVEPTDPVYRRNFLQHRKRLSDMLNDMKLEVLQRTSSSDITTVLIEGDNLDSLLALTRKEGADLIVTAQNYTLNSGNSGNVALSLIEESSCPVIAVPENGSVPKFKNIVYASDLEFIDIAAIRELTSFASYYGAEVTILNLSDQTKRISEEDLFRFEKKVRETSGYSKLDFIYFHGSDLHHHIQEYTNRNQADMLVITTIKESLSVSILDFQKKNHSFRNIPIMAFHETDQCCQKVL